MYKYKPVEDHSKLSSEWISEYYKHLVDSLTKAGLNELMSRKKYLDQNIGHLEKQYSSSLDRLENPDKPHRRDTINSELIALLKQIDPRFEFSNSGENRKTAEDIRKALHALRARRDIIEGIIAQVLVGGTVSNKSTTNDFEYLTENAELKSRLDAIRQIVSDPSYESLKTNKAIFEKAIELIGLKFLSGNPANSFRKYLVLKFKQNNWPYPIGRKAWVSFFEQQNSGKEE